MSPSFPFHSGHANPDRVMLIHGAGGGPFEWRAWASVFAAAGHNVQCPELVPGSAGLAETTYADYRSQLQLMLEEFAREAPQTRWVLVGASLGGLLALDLAQSALNRDRVRAVVLVNPVPPAPFAGDVPWEAVSGEIKAWGDTASLAGTARSLPDAHPSTWDWVWPQWRNESAQVLRHIQSGIPLQRPACPVLMMIGERDDAVPPAVSKRVAAWLAADSMVLDGASHVGPLLGERAAQCAARALAWLAFRG